MATAIKTQEARFLHATAKHLIAKNRENRSTGRESMTPEPSKFA
jgi:hypothetical protein